MKIKPETLEAHSTSHDPETGETTRVQIGMTESGQFAVRASNRETGEETFFGPYNSWEEANGAASRI